MHLSLSTSFFRRRFFKNSSIAMAGMICAVSVAGCSIGQTTAQEKSPAMTNFAYTLPAKSMISVQTKNTKAAENPVKTAPTEMKPVVKVSKTNYAGRAPHICTPSGFGSKARCFDRS